MRKLAALTCAFSAAIFAANYILPDGSAALWALLPAALSALLALMGRKWLRPVVLALLGAALGLGCFALQELRFTEPCRALDGESRELRARVLDYPDERDSYGSVLLRLETEGLPRVKAVLSWGSEKPGSLEPGQLLRFRAKIRTADQRYGRLYRGDYARGVLLRLRADGPVLAFDRGFDLRTVPVRLRHALSTRALSLFSKDTAPFFKALMLGDKTDLYEDGPMELALSRAGLMHVTAVSGMHVAFLLGLLQLLFGRTRRSSLLCMGLLWGFVLVTGASPSAMRAGLMQSLLLLAPLVRRENDPPTALFTALALLLLFNPRAAASVSLQLSFAAMAGILCFAQPLQDALSAPFAALGHQRLINALTAAPAASLSAMVFSIPLTALHFGSVALLAPLSNLLALWAVSLCFGGAYAACLLSWLWMPLGQGLAWGISWLARYVLWIARLIAKLPFAVLYMRGGLALLTLVLIYGVFLLSFMSSLRRGWKVLLPTVLSVLILFSTQGLTALSYSRGPGTFAVLDVGQGQCLCAIAGDKTLLIDCGSLWNGIDAGETAGEYLLSRGRRQVDLMLLTHLHEDHVNGLRSLLERVPVSMILTAAPIAEEEDEFEALCELAAEYDTALLCLERDTDMSLGKIGLRLFVPSDNVKDEQHCMMMLVSLDGYDVLVTGDAPAAAEKALLARQPLHDVELLIAGHHGSSDASSEQLLSTIGADTAAISVGYNSYGHPKQETLERLASYGYTVYRTDRDGDIEIRAGQTDGKTN